MLRVIEGGDLMVWLVVSCIEAGIGVEVEHFVSKNRRLLCIISDLELVALHGRCRAPSQFTLVSVRMLLLPELVELLVEL